MQFIKEKAKRKVLSVIFGLFLSSTVFAANFTLLSTGFSDGQKLPPEYTCNKGSSSPELHWTNAPKNTQAFALLAKGLDSPMGIVYGWVLFNIPANVTALPAAIQNLPDGTQIGKNALGRYNYYGPCPPDSAQHHYEFELFALNSPLTVSSDADVKDIVAAIKAASIAQAKLGATFKH
jgi:Raf kinase inhibitor-like YbhB/YbcL family protein